MGLDRRNLTNEAVSIDGLYIEDAIPGYTTLKTAGREALSLEYDSFTTGASNGETIKSARYPARVITVEFLLTDRDITSLRAKLNHLNNLLSNEEADFVFNDESDKFFKGIPIVSGDFEKGKGWVKGSWQIFCADPFKYSAAVYTAMPAAVNEHSAEFIINYAGTYPARPVLLAEFAGALSGGDYSDDGDCGYIAFIDGSGNIIQLGNPDAIDLDAFTQAEHLLNRQFTTLDDWQQTGGKAYADKAISGSVSTGNITDTYWNKGAGQSLPFAMPFCGSGNRWHGPALWKSTQGAVNFEVSIVHRLCASAVDQIGTFECGVYNSQESPSRMIASFVIEKSASGTNGTVKYIVNDKAAGSDSIDLSYYNTHFGYCSRTAVYKTQYYNKKKKKWQDRKIRKAKTRSVVSGYTYTQSNLNSSIKKADGNFTFKVGNLPARVYADSDLEMTPAHNISFHFGANGSSAAMHTNAINSVRFTRNPSGTFADIPNVFTSGDIVEADCNDASVYIRHANTENGHYEPQYGALGNDWEDFKLQKGQNSIKAVWSDWVKTAYKPQLKIYYSEVYL